MKVGFPTNFEKAQELAHILSQYLHTNFCTLLAFQVFSFLLLAYYLFFFYQFQ